MYLGINMTPTFNDYTWDQGRPRGLGSGTTYRVVVDPYRRRFSIEKYDGDRFIEQVYDSQLLDFRDLTPRAQRAWQKETVEENPHQIINLIRNQDDRLLYREICHFKQGRCTECETTTPFGYHLSKHSLQYEDFGDPFNGVILYDRIGKPVMEKRYQFDKETGLFTDLLSENWAPSCLPATGTSGQT